jgi:D-alanine-D-alanine ligase
MTIGLIYDLFDDYEWQHDDPDDADAELEPEETIHALENAFWALGHTPIRIGTAHQLLKQLPDLRLDAAMSIAEIGISRNREAYALVLLEMAGIPHLGSDALTVSLSVDKVWTNDLAEAVGVRCPKRWVMKYEQPNSPNAFPFAQAIAHDPQTQGSQLRDLETHDLETFPLFVKPRYEGTSKGITPLSKVRTQSVLEIQIQRIWRDYKQDALVEEFIEGSEFTVAITGNNPPEALPVLQRATETSSGIGLHALERKGVDQQDWSYEVTSVLTLELEAELQRLALMVYNKLECKDYARADFRVTPNGTPYFLEINTLPTFAPDGSFAILAELMGISYTEFLAKVLGEGLRRLRF